MNAFVLVNTGATQLTNELRSRRLYLKLFVNRYFAIFLFSLSFTLCLFFLEPFLENLVKTVSVVNGLFLYYPR